MYNRIRLLDDNLKSDELRSAHVITCFDCGRSTQEYEYSLDAVKEWNKKKKW